MAVSIQKKIRIFTAWPRVWTEASFDRLQETANILGYVHSKLVHGQVEGISTEIHLKGLYLVDGMRRQILEFISPIQTKKNRARYAELIHKRDTVGSLDDRESREYEMLSMALSYADKVDAGEDEEMSLEDLPPEMQPRRMGDGA